MISRATLTGCQAVTGIPSAAAMPSDWSTTVSVGTGTSNSARLGTGIQHLHGNSIDLQGQLKRTD